MAYETSLDTINTAIADTKNRPWPQTGTTQPVVEGHCAGPPSLSLLNDLNLFLRQCSHSSYIQQYAAVLSTCPREVQEAFEEELKRRTLVLAKEEQQEYQRARELKVMEGIRYSQKKAARVLSGPQAVSATLSTVEDHHVYKLSPLYSAEKNEEKELREETKEAPRRMTRLQKKLRTFDK